MSIEFVLVNEKVLDANSDFIPMMFEGQYNLKIDLDGVTGVPAGDLALNKKCTILQMRNMLLSKAYDYPNYLIMHNGDPVGFTACEMFSRPSTMLVVHRLFCVSDDLRSQVFEFAVKYFTDKAQKLQIPQLRFIVRSGKHGMADIVTLEKHGFKSRSVHLVKNNSAYCSDTFEGILPDGYERVPSYVPSSNQDDTLLAKIHEIMNFVRNNRDGDKAAAESYINVIERARGLLEFLMQRTDGKITGVVGLVGNAAGLWAHFPVAVSKEKGRELLDSVNMVHRTITKVPYINLTCQSTDPLLDPVINPWFEGAEREICMSLTIDDTDFGPKLCPKCGSSNICGQYIFTKSTEDEQLMEHINRKQFRLDMEHPEIPPFPPVQAGYPVTIEQTSDGRWFLLVEGEYSADERRPVSAILECRTCEKTFDNPFLKAKASA